MITRVLLAVPVVTMLALSLLVHAPARLLAAQTPPGLGAYAWSGTLLDGRMAGRYRGLPYQFSWSVDVTPLLRLGLRTSCRLDGPVQAVFQVDARATGGSLVVSELIWSPAASAWLGDDQQVGRWTGHDIRLARHDGTWQQVAGTLRSPGGPRQLSLDGQRESIVLPAVEAQLLPRDDGLGLDLRQADGAALATVTWNATQQLRIRVLERLARLRRGHVPGPDADRVVLEVAQPMPAPWLP